MKGILSPVIEHIVQTTIRAIGEKERMDKAVGRHRKMLQHTSGNYRMSEVEFALADLLITRDGPGDWAEAGRLYDHVLETAIYGYLRGAALIGKAELAVRSLDNKKISEAITLGERALKILHEFVGPEDFFTLKSLLVVAELRLKRNEDKDIKEAIKLFQKAIDTKNANPYWKARALVNISELHRGTKGKEAKKFIGYCQQSVKLLIDRPDDYFVYKAYIVEGEIRFLLKKTVDRKKAMDLMSKVIYAKNSDIDLKVRAKLDKAEVMRREKGLKLCTEVIGMPNLDQYLYDKATALQAAIKVELKR